MIKQPQPHRLRISNAEIVVICEALNKLDYIPANTAKKRIIWDTACRFNQLKLNIDERILKRTGGFVGDPYHGRPRRAKYYDERLNEFWKEYVEQVKEREGGMAALLNGTVSDENKEMKK